MPKPRKPTAVLEASGAYDKNPKRALERENEPQVTAPIGEPPMSFLIREPELGYQKAQRLWAAWVEIVSQAFWLSSADRQIVELTCQLKVLVNSGNAKSADRKDYITCLGKLGLTPADRTKIDAPKKQPEGDSSVLAQIAQESRRARPN